MEQHPNARLTPRGRETLVSRVKSGLGVAEAARQMGVSRQTASKWLARARRGEALVAAARAAYAELLPDERRGAAFMGRALHFFAGLGVAVDRVMTDNGPGYHSGEFNALLAAADAPRPSSSTIIGHVRTARAGDFRL